MGKRKLAIKVLVTGLIASAICGVNTPATAEPESASKPTARLVVKVVQVGGRPGKVTVRGPAGFTQTLGSTTTLRRLAPGRYRISAAAVGTRSWRSTPTISRRAVVLGDAARGRTVVRYGTAVNRQVETVAPSGIQQFEAPSESGTGRLVSTEDLQVGSIVASGTGPATPEGMLVKVTAVDDTSGGDTYSVEQATLQEALPAGEFSTSFSADLADPEEAPARRGQGGQVAAQAKPLPVKCSGGADAGLSGTAFGEIEFSMSAKWDFADSSVTLRATPRAGAAVRAWAEAAAECRVDDYRLFERRFAPITLQVGPVPVVILPKLEMFLGGELEATGVIETSGSVSMQSGLRATASRNGLTVSKQDPTFTSSAGLQTSAEVEAEVYAKARLTSEIYGVAGPHVQVRMAVEADADKDSDPWWRVDATLQAGVGVKVDKCVKVFFKDLCLRLDESKDDVLSARHRIVDSGGPFDPGGDSGGDTGEEISEDVAGEGVTVEDSDTDDDGGGTGRIDIGGGDQWVLSTGSIAGVPAESPDVAGDATEASTNRGAPGDPTLGSLASAETYDATFVRFDVVPSGNRLRVDYLFASEEYPEFVNEGYNDVVGVFVDGVNCALVPGTDDPVSVDSVNASSNSEYFVDNQGGARPTTMDGLTTPLSCVQNVTPGQRVSVLIGVADAGDEILDSAVALLDGGISSYNQ